MKPVFNRASDLEKFTQHFGLRDAKKINYEGRYIYLAETDLEHDKPNEYPWGYYQTAWFVSHPESDEKIDGGAWLEFDAMHDTEQSWTAETKRIARQNAAIQQAISWLKHSKEVGRYA